MASALAGIWLLHMPLWAFESDLWQQYEDDRAYFDIVREGLLLHQDLSENSPVTEARLPLGPIAYDQARFRVRRSGLVEVLSPSNIKGEDLGQTNLVTGKSFRTLPASISVSLRKGQTFEYLQDLGQGSCLVRVNRNVMLLDACLWMDGFASDF